MDMRTKHRVVYEFLSLKPEKMRDRSLINRDYPEMKEKLNAAMKDKCIGADKIVVWWKC